MDVRCPQCQTLYEFDERQIRAGAVTLKCSQCQHLFRLEASTGLSGENSRRWMVRNAQSGDILYFTHFDVLHRWIMDRSVTEHDLISRTGNKWKALGELGEFMPIFQVVESIANIAEGAASNQARDSSPSTRASREQPTGPGPGSQPRNAPQRADDGASQRARPVPKRSRVSTSPQFPAQAQTASRNPELREPVATPTTPNQAPMRRGPVGSQAPATNRAPAMTPSPGPSTNPAPTPTPGRAPALTPSGNQSKPRVQLDRGQFGSAPGALEVGPLHEQEDAWSMGDLSLPLTASESTSDVFDYSPPRTKMRTVMIVVGLLLVGGLAYTFVFHKEDVETWLASLSQPEVVSIGGTSEGADLKGGNPGEPDEALLQKKAEEAEAEKAAREAARAEVLKQVEEATAAAASGTAAALEPAIAAAEKAHRPSIREILAQAKRALQRGDGERARRLYHQAIELDSNNAEAITGLGWALLAVGSPDSAVAQFQRILHRDPSVGDAYIGLGRAQRARGDLRAAAEAYEGYLRRYPGGPKASIARYQSEQLRESIGP